MQNGMLVDLVMVAVGFGDFFLTVNHSSYTKPLPIPTSITEGDTFICHPLWCCTSGDKDDFSY